MKKIALILLLLSQGAMADDVLCGDAIIKEFHKARALYLSPESIRARGFQDPRMKAWKEGVDRLSEKCPKLSYIDLPFGRAIGVSSLYDLMFAYINGKGIEEYQAQFSLALVCHEKPDACSKYIEKPSADAFEDFLDN